MLHALRKECGKVVRWKKRPSRSRFWRFLLRQTARAARVRQKKDSTMLDASTKPCAVRTDNTR